MDHVRAQSTKLKLAAQTVVPVRHSKVYTQKTKPTQEFCAYTIDKITSNFELTANCSSLTCTGSSNACEIVDGVAQCRCGLSPACVGGMPLCEQNSNRPDDPEEYRCMCSGISCTHPNPICDSDRVCRVIINLYTILQKLVGQ